MSIDIAEPIINLRKSRGIYDRELGSDGASADDYLKELYRGAFRNYWKNAFERYYRGEVSVDGRRVALIELPKEYLPDRVLGMTDCFSTIWMRNDLEKFYGLRKRVLEHEKEHVRDPAADEMTVRKRTNTVSLAPYYAAAA